MATVPPIRVPIVHEYLRGGIPLVTSSNGRQTLPLPVRSIADDITAERKVVAQLRKAVKLAAVLRRVNAATVAADMLPQMWGMAVQLAKVASHSATEPVSPTVRAMVLVLLEDDQ